MAKGSLNKVMIIGSLGQDPELKYTPQGASVCSFSLATDEGYKDKDGKQVDRTEWHRCVAWGKLGEVIAQYNKKGSKIYIEGKLQTRNWEKDGQKHYTTEIVASEMTMLGGKGEAQTVPKSEAPKPKAAPVFDIPDADTEDDDLPF